ncbi:hypothetical protein C8J55DRAFT_560263 [Lentinula edodes]|uniref:Uncharacterized protein n=1 Tax=Lentinula lateritia TaxID=40482 RepID=A0A9W9AHB5_9AGAR|nr:hypothetical protein C8J55DRAFT_560263 [Lentinula edodes]
MDGNVGNISGGSTNGDQISRLLQSFMATPNAQMLELMSQNQYPPMLLQSLLLLQTLSQNLPNQAPSFPVSSSVSSSLQAASSQPSHAPPYMDTSLPTQTPTDPVLQSQVSSLLSQVPNLPSSQSLQIPIAPPLLPPNQHQPPSVSSSSQLTQSSSPLTLPPNQHQHYPPPHLLSTHYTGLYISRQFSNAANELASFLCERERKESNGHSNQPI